MKGESLGLFARGDRVDYFTKEGLGGYWMPGMIVKLHKSTTPGVAEIRKDGGGKISRKLRHVRHRVV